MSPGAPAPRVLMVSSNGAGMGHLTRLTAVARRAEGRADLRFASMSQAVAVATRGRYPYTYIPSAGDLGIGPRRWNVLLARRFGRLLDEQQPQLVVFDGSYPYAGLLACRSAHPGTRFVWSRRGLWKPGAGSSQLARAAAFDLVLEPGELAAGHDRGLTAGRSDATRVRPVVLLDPDDLLARDDARRALGLRSDGPAALVTLGAGNLAEVGSDLGAVVAGLLRSVPGLQVAVTAPAIASAEAAPLDPRVVRIDAHPVSRYLHAFDLAVAAAGYNSFHESVAHALPTAFVANTTQLDDQPARARWAHESGAGVLLTPSDPRSLADAMAALADPQWRAQTAQTCRRLWPGNGAQQAADAALALVAGPGGER